MKLLFFTILLSFNLYSQIPITREFTLSQSNSLFNSRIIALSNNYLAALWLENSTLYFSKSSDYGIYWEPATQLLPDVSFSNSGLYTVIVTNSGRIILIYKNTNVFEIYSDDNGQSFSNPQQLNLVYPGITISCKLTKSGLNDLYFSYTKGSSSVYFIKRTDDGNSWSNEILVRTIGIARGVFSSPDNKIHAFYSTANYWYKTVSTDSGISWDYSDLIGEKNSGNIILAGDTLWMGYDNTYNSDIVFSKSTDYGDTWFPEFTYTKYLRNDNTADLQTFQNNVLFSFSSARAYSNGTPKTHRYFGILNVTEDLNTPPIHSNSYLFYPAGYNIEIKIRTEVLDVEGIESVILIYYINGFIDSSNFVNTSSNTYEIIIPPVDSPYTFIYNILVNDVDGNSVLFKGDSISVTEKWYEINALFNINKIKLPVNNSGVTGEVTIPPNESGGRYDGKNFLFSGGFFLSGKSNDQLWANAVASASRIQDYYPGPVNSNPEDSANIVYTVHDSDTPFGESWQKWSDAVELGADFYDGNNNGIYEPVDLNGNEVWDLTEDRPDLIGDMVSWCVYNDGVPDSLRRFNDVQPQGIEIHQTVFGNYPSNNQIENIVYIRYRLINKGTVVQVMDSVYFGVWSDPDLGEVADAYLDDLIGTDTLLNSVYVYNDGPDNDWGINPPAFFQQIVQGSVTYIPGETFIDNNSNGIYDPGTDTPLDSARQNNGLFLGSEIFPGAKNQIFSSSIHYMSSHQTLGDPNDKFQARYYMLGGKTKFGNPIDPCTWPYSIVAGGVNCSQVNPIFIYSGDPVTYYGWINTFDTDQRMMANTGPFVLKANEPIDIIVGYIIGRGYDHLNSITKARQNAAYSRDYYNTNFTYLPPVGVDKNEIEIVKSFILYQNYPNPFNPVTTIKYHLSELSRVSLKVFDILGQEVKTLINKEQNAGIYEINFDASTLSSGIYFYELRTMPNGRQAEKFSSVKKMILIK